MTITLLAPAFTPDRRPGCPVWCDGACMEWDDQLHSAPTVQVPVTAEKEDATAFVAIEMGRVDREDGQPGAIEIDIYVDKAAAWVGDHAKMTSAQARHLAAELLNVADLADGLATR